MGFEFSVTITQVNDMPWKAVAFKVGDTVERHALPLDDKLPHPESKKCWCCPVEQDGVWVHQRANGEKASRE